jgi:hypothetical protein
MKENSWRLFRPIALGLAFALIGLIGVAGSRHASAAPAGAAQNLGVYDQRCLSNGTVQVTFVWNPSGQGTQWFDITRLPNFAAFGNKGPLAANAYFTDWTLESNTTFFARVTTFSAQGPLVSDILQFQTRNCAGAFTPPTNAQAQTFNDYVRVTWNRGNGNLFYCVDTAFSRAEVEGFFGSARNWGCGTTGTSLDLNNLACGREHWARVWAAGNGTSGYSNTFSFTSQSCDFSPPGNPDASVRSDNTVRITWTRGNDNHFFCIDFALNDEDLEEQEDTWFNRGCGTTGTAVDVTGLACGTTYLYRIWAAGTSESGYSPTDSFTTASCPFDPPINLEATVQADDTVLFEWEEQDNAFWFCIDIAGSQAHLLNFGPSWTNFDCGGTDEMAQVTSDYFDCGETYYWRVFAFAGNLTGYSEVASFTMNCP